MLFRSAISAALALSACKGGGAGAATKYIPDGAEFIGGMQLSKVVGEGGFKADLDKALEGEKKAKEAFDAMKGCNIDVMGLEQFVMGGTQKEDFAFVLVGAGVGVPANLTCINDKMKEMKGSDKDGIVVDGKKIKIDDGEKVAGFIVDDKTVVVASKSWTTSVEALVGGTGKSAVDGGLKDAIALTDQSKHVWFAGKVPAEAAEGPAAGLTTAGGSMDVSGGGLGLSIKGKFDAAEKAAAAAAAANAGFEQVKPMAGAMGLPQGLVDSVKIEAAGDVITVSAKASKDDLEALKKKAMEGGLPGM